MTVILDLFGGSGGVGRCTREILRQLASEREPTLLCGQSHVVDSFQDCRQSMPDLLLANLERPKFSVKSLKIRMAARGDSRSPALANALLAETIAAGRGRGSSAPVLVNYPQVIAPPTRHGEFGIFLHDLNWRLYPGNFLDPERTDGNCRGWVERATKVITNSECTRDEVIERYQCAGDKVVAAPLAPFTEQLPQAFDAAKYLATLGLMAGHFDLFPGVWGLHKGHELLTQALEEAHAAQPVVVTCGLPLSGIDGSTPAVAGLRQSLAARWDQLIAARKLVVVGGVPEREMQALRSGCRAYVIPAQYEGYGFPLAEAICQHRPAIVSDIKAHQELLKRYPEYKLATLFPADSSNALAAKLDNLAAEPIQMPKDWPKYIASSWSWKNTVRDILSALNSTEALKP